VGQAKISILKEWDELLAAILLQNDSLMPLHRRVLHVSLVSFVRRC